MPKGQCGRYPGALGHRFGCWPWTGSARPLPPRGAQTACAAAARGEAWSSERQAQYNAAVAAQVHRRGGHGASAGAGPAAPAAAPGEGPGDTAMAEQAVADDRRRQWHAALEPRAPSTSYRCQTCSLTFDRPKQLAQHLSGRRHAANAARASAYWEEFVRSSWYSPDAAPEWVTSAWSLDEFLRDLPRRSRAHGSGIAPHVMLSSLAPEKRFRLWRYLREVMPTRRDLPEAFAALERRGDGRFARVKEVLESCETFLHVEQCILRSTPGAKVRRRKVRPPPTGSPYCQGPSDLSFG